MNTQQRQCSITRSSRRAFRQRRHAVAASVLAFCAGLGIAHAGPTGAQISAGSAVVQVQGSKTTITQEGTRAVIDWRSFNIDRNEWVDFRQPSAASVTLNRVNSGDPSSILGRLTANGQVYLVNPNGILFGRDAQVDVAGLVASTANISNPDFMAGRMRFDQSGKPGASVINEGSISVAEGGLLAFVAPQVKNDGVIHARLGKVSLAAGDAFVLDLYGDQLVNLIIDQPMLAQLTDAHGLPLAARIDQTGTILADGGHVQLTAVTARRLVDNVINVSGLVRATSVESRNGVISLRGDGHTRVTLAGTLQTTGEIGGRIEITGRDVELTGTARVDASGASGGGTVAVGGGWQGTGSLPTARVVQMDAGASVVANADTKGSGGTISLWSVESTQFNGLIQARGSGVGGNGGRIEVSSEGQLGFLGSVNLSAPQGRAGSLLLDPLNLTIGSAASGDSVVGANEIRALLLSGVSVSLTATNDVTVNSTVDGRGRTSGGALTLTAGRDLMVNRNIVLADGALNLTAQQGSLTTAAGVTLATGSGDILLTGGASVNVGSLLTTGNILVNSAHGGVSLARTVQGAGNGVAAASLTVNAQGGGITLNGALTQGPVSLVALDDILINGDIQTLTGNVALQSSNGAVKAFVAPSTDGAPSNTPINADASIIAGTRNTNSSITIRARQNVELAGVVAQGGLEILSEQGDVYLQRTMGGSSTGYTLYELGYQSALRPDVGRVRISAPTGSIQLHGLNLDGSDAPGVSGLEINAAHMIISDRPIAVNKGDIFLTAGQGSTDGIALGAGIYSRGLDQVTSTGRSKQGYGIHLAGANLALFDNTNEVADLRDIYELKYFDGTGILRSLLTNASGELVDFSGNLVLDSANKPQIVYVHRNDGSFYGIVSEDTAPRAPDGATLYRVIGSPVNREISKIEITNNAANYITPSNEVDIKLVDAMVGTAPMISIDVGRIGGLRNLTPLGAGTGLLDLSDLIPMSTVPRRVAGEFLPDQGKVISPNGIALKLLGYAAAEDRSTEVWSDYVKFSNNTSGPGIICLSNCVGNGFPIAGPNQGIIHLTTASDYETWARSTTDPALPLSRHVGLVRYTLVIDRGTEGAVAKVAKIELLDAGGNVIDQVRQVSVPSADGTTNVLVDSWVPTPGLAPIRCDWLSVCNYAHLGYAMPVRFSGAPKLDDPGRMSSISVVGNIVQAGQTPVAVDSNNGALPGRVAWVTGPDATLEPGPTGNIVKSINQGNGQLAYQVTGGYVSSSTTPSLYSSSISGTRFFLFDGVAASAVGQSVVDSATGIFVPGLGQVGGGFNSSNTGFGSVGAGFLPPDLPQGESRSVGSVNGSNDFTRPADRQAVVRDDADKNIQGTIRRPALDADLGRNSGSAGAPINVFAKPYYLVTSADRSLCAGESTAQGTTGTRLVVCKK